MAKKSRKSPASKAQPASPRHRPGRGPGVKAETFRNDAPTLPKRTLVDEIFSSPARTFGLAPISYLPATQMVQTTRVYNPPEKKTPAKKRTALKLSEPVTQSPTARETKKCKARPDGHNPRRANGRVSKKFVPWCD